jgi:DNA-binding transcriptional ArsR family regulator
VLSESETIGGTSVVARVDISARSQKYLQRLSVVYASQLRLTIVTELYLREMSPTQFYREFGGGSVARVERHFKRLAQYGWLELVREESGGERRGGREHFYRATELAILDDKISSLLPYSVRAVYGWMAFKRLAEQVRGALDGDTFDARSDRRLSSTSLLLDRLGWDRVVGAIAGLFEGLRSEQEEARLRIFESGEKPFLVTNALVAFESPTELRSSPGDLGLADLADGVDSLAPVVLRLAKVFADGVCLRILEELNLREMSVTQFHREIGGASKSAIRYRFDMLEQIGWLVKMGKLPHSGRRGPREHVYRAAGPALSSGGIWSGVPESAKATDGWRAFERITALVKEAIRAGTFDARSDRHITWSLLLLDQIGWERLIAALADQQVFIAEERERARIRLAESGETPLKMTVAMMAFESPKNSVKAP